MLRKRTRAKIWSGVFLLALIAVAAFTSFAGKNYYSQDHNQSDAQAQEKSGGWTAEDRIAEYTWWLAVMTGLLAVIASSQLYFLNRSDKTARITASATADTVKQLREKERARLIATNVVCGVAIPAGQNKDAKTVKRSIGVYARFYNYGATPALIGKTRIKFVIATAIPERVTLRDVEAHPAYFQVPIMPADSGGLVKLERQIELSAEDARKIDNDLRVFVIGSIVYKDIFGVVRTFVFASKRTSSGVVPTKGDAYNRDYEPYYEE